MDQEWIDGSVDLYRNCTEYREVFGDSNGELLLGNEAIHQMTFNANYKL